MMSKTRESRSLFSLRIQTFFFVVVVVAIIKNFEILSANNRSHTIIEFQLFYLTFNIKSKIILLVQ